MTNWWADRLAGKQVQRPAANPNVQYRQVFPPITAPRRTPVSATQPVLEDRCPACNSQNYMSAPGSKYKRCYDCGYPITQSGSGVVATQSDAPAKKAVQVQSDGYSPTTIVGKVDS